MITDLLTKRKAVDDLLSTCRHARQRLRAEKKALYSTRQLIGNLEQAQVYTQQVALQVQTQAHDRIAGVVSRCLEAVFDEPYTFKLIFETKRGKTEARLIFERDGLEVDPMTAAGGGVVDVAAFALRLSCLMLSRPPLRRLIALDEPFRFVHEAYRDRMSSLLQTLSKEMDVQILMVTHIREMVSGEVLQV